MVGIVPYHFAKTCWKSVGLKKSSGQLYPYLQWGSENHSSATPRPRRQPTQNRYHNGTLPSGNRNPSCLILSHTHLERPAQYGSLPAKPPPAANLDLAELKPELYCSGLEEGPLPPLKKGEKKRNPRKTSIGSPQNGLFFILAMGAHPGQTGAPWLKLAETRCQVLGFGGETPQMAESLLMSLARKNALQ